MEISTLISTISLLLSAYTLFICYVRSLRFCKKPLSDPFFFVSLLQCIYNQDHNILTQLSQGNTRFAEDISNQMSLSCLSSESQVLSSIIVLAICYHQHKLIEQVPVSYYRFLVDIAVTTQLNMRV